jgi:hypothetical protein
MLGKEDQLRKREGKTALLAYSVLSRAGLGRSKREPELTHANAFVCRDYHSSCQNAQHQWQD